MASMGMVSVEGTPREGISAQDILAQLGGELKGQTVALKKEKELKYLDDMINLKQQQLKA